MIRVEHLKKEYEAATPLIDVNAEIQDGEVISIIGPSGTGKSTFLRCLNLLEKPTEGRIFIDGEEITGKKSRVHLLRQKMGMVFQNFNLFSNLNIIENIMAAPVELLGKTRQEAYDSGMELLRSVGLEDRALAFPDELSGGQKQRAAIARTLAMEPSILLFDEPTSALDPTMIAEVLAVIRNLTRKGLTILIVTHEMRFAREVCDRVFYMDEGVIYEQGTPEEIFEHPQKEKTRQFIRQLKVLELETESGTFSLSDAAAKIEEYGFRNQIPPKTIYRMQSVFEELCVQLLLPELPEPARILTRIEFSAKTQETVMTVRYSGPVFRPQDSENEISMAFVRSAVSSMEHTQIDEDGCTNQVVLKLRT